MAAFSTAWSKLIKRIVIEMEIHSADEAKQVGWLAGDTPASNKLSNKLHVGMQLWSLLALLILSLVFSPLKVHAAALIFDGSFESGTFQGWQPAGTGSAIIATRATCFSTNDTTGLGFQGSYAGLLRGGTGTRANPPSLTSRPFTAGRGVSFMALSELRGDWPEEDYPFALTVSILDGAGNLLKQHELATQMVDLPNGCPSQPADHAFSPLFVSTLAYAGRSIKIRFSHHPDFAIKGGVTLVDEVIRYEVDDIPNYHSTPFAIAGVSQTSSGTLMLEPELPANGAGAAYDWEFSWYIHGESDRRYYYNPCIDDLEPGKNYTATLYIRANGRLSRDTVRFIVPYTESTEVDTEADTDDTDTTDDACNLSHPSLLAEEDNGEEEGEDNGENEGEEEIDAGGEEGEEGEDIISPSIELTPTNIIQLNTQTLFLDRVEITLGSSDVITNGLIRFSTANAGDQLIPPSVAAIGTDIIVDCTTATSCTLTSAHSNVSRGEYETLFKKFMILLATQQESVIELSIEDENGRNAHASITAQIAAPAITATTTDTFTAGTDTPIFSSITVSTGNSAQVTSASVNLVGSEPGDILVNAGSTTPPTVCNTAGTECTWTGSDTAANYANAIAALRVSLINSAEIRVVQVTVTDENNLSTTETFTFGGTTP